MVHSIEFSVRKSLTHPHILFQQTIEDFWFEHLLVIDSSAAIAPHPIVACYKFQTCIMRAMQYKIK